MGERQGAEGFRRGTAVITCIREACAPHREGGGVADPVVILRRNIRIIGDVHHRIAERDGRRVQEGRGFLQGRGPAQEGGGASVIQRAAQSDRVAADAGEVDRSAADGAAEVSIETAVNEDERARPGRARDGAGRIRHTALGE